MPRIAWLPWMGPRNLGVMEASANGAGDVEKDFWLAYDLLQNPKDHAEFTIVRNWIQKALEVGDITA